MLISLLTVKIRGSRCSLNVRYTRQFTYIRNYLKMSLNHIISARMQYNFMLYTTIGKAKVHKQYFSERHCRAHSMLAPSQWETSLQSNAVSHWLGANLESALHRIGVPAWMWFSQRFNTLFVCFGRIVSHDDAIKYKHFPRYWPFVQGVYRSPVYSPHKGQWRGALMFSLIFARIKGWANHRDAGYLRRHRIHYDVRCNG